MISDTATETNQRLILNSAIPAPVANFNFKLQWKSHPGYRLFSVCGNTLHGHTTLYISRFHLPSLLETRPKHCVFAFGGRLSHCNYSVGRITAWATVHRTSRDTRASFNHLLFIKNIFRFRLKLESRLGLGMDSLW